MGLSLFGYTPFALRSVRSTRLEGQARPSSRVLRTLLRTNALFRACPELAEGANGQVGFTLLEILIVIIIISIVTGVALLRLTSNENRKLEMLTEEFVQHLTFAEEQAMLQPAVLGVMLDREGYQFARYQAATIKNKKAVWVPLQAMHAIPSDVRFALDAKLDEKKTDKLPQIIISTNGEVTPFLIYVGKKGKPPRYVIKGEADGHVSSQSLS